MDIIEIQTIIDSGLLILIWLVQLIIYPSFLHIGTKDFVDWHNRYIGRIGMIVIPLMLSQVGIEIMYIVQHDYRLSRILMIVAIWISTFSLSVPCHNRLHKDGKNSTITRHLITSNWIRTILWSMLFLGTVFA